MKRLIILSSLIIHSFCSFAQVNILGIEYNMQYEEAERILQDRLGDKNVDSLANIITYGKYGKEVYVYNSKWSNISFLFSPKEEGHTFKSCFMWEMFLSKEECEYNVQNFISSIEKEFHIKMAKKVETDSIKGEKITYTGGLHPENDREALSITYFGSDDYLYVAMVCFFPILSTKEMIENNHNYYNSLTDNNSKINQPTPNPKREHLKFIGFELNGTIDEFHKKMLSKGMELSPSNHYLPIGQRCYDGIFSSQKSSIVVWYNPKTKIVYRGKAIIERYGKIQIEQLQSDIRNKLDAKYGITNRFEESVKDDYYQEFNQYTYTLPNGSISLFITSTGYTAQEAFHLHIDYHDKENEFQSRLEEMDDL